MVSNEEIKRKLGDKKEGKGINGYLVCDTCQGMHHNQEKNQKILVLNVNAEEVGPGAFSAAARRWIHHGRGGARLVLEADGPPRFGDVAAAWEQLLAGAQIADTPREGAPSARC